MFDHGRSLLGLISAPHHGNEPFEYGRLAALRSPRGFAAKYSRGGTSAHHRVLQEAAGAQRVAWPQTTSPHRLKQPGTPKLGTGRQFSLEIAIYRVPFFWGASSIRTRNEHHTCAIGHMDNWTSFHWFVWLRVPHLPNLLTKAAAHQRDGAALLLPHGQLRRGQWPQCQAAAEGGRGHGGQVAARLGWLGVWVAVVGVRDGGWEDRGNSSGLSLGDEDELGIGGQDGARGSFWREFVEFTLTPKTCFGMSRSWQTGPTPFQQDWGCRMNQGTLGKPIPLRWSPFLGRASTSQRHQQLVSHHLAQTPWMWVKSPRTAGESSSFPCKSRWNQATPRPPRSS